MSTLEEEEKEEREEQEYEEEKESLQVDEGIIREERVVKNATYFFGARYNDVELVAYEEDGEEEEDHELPEDIPELHEELKESLDVEPQRDVPSIPMPLTTELFGGATISYVHCMNCKRTTSKTEEFVFLALELEPVPTQQGYKKKNLSSEAPRKRKGKKKKRNRPSKSETEEKQEELIPMLDFSPSRDEPDYLEPSLFKNDVSSALARFTSPEILHKQNLFECDECFLNKGKTVGVRRLCLQRLPRVLCLQLKVFQADFRGGYKISRNVEIQTLLDLTDYTRLGCVQSPDYELFGVICHQGNLGEGHYYNYVRKRAKWFYCSDEVVKPCSKEEAVGDPNQYLCFYRVVE